MESNSKITYEQAITNQGFTISKQLRDSNRFVAYLIQKNDKQFFFKGVRETENIKLQNEVWFYLTIKKLDESKKLLVHTQKLLPMQKIGISASICPVVY